ncbi:MAG: histidinol dehydrogenase [Bryobacterales bacterium]|nr:histidinol dehydrogenase [Bryobacteraceae bacterium]MDW8353650.1 histidinol dehydrogenase [Bryobacterales bacterium]
MTSKEAEGLLARRGARLAEAERVVAPILEDVRRRGDAALIEYARRLDGLGDRPLAVSRREMVQACEEVGAAFFSALDSAYRNIRRFAERQVPQEFWIKFPDGHRAGQIVRPLDSVAAYVPGGRYPLPSTLLMTVVPAQAAGVRLVTAASPKPAREVLATAHFLRLERMFRVGGAQAIAAFAFGTETIPRADRIVGPGNLYVAAAKKLLAGEVAIDFIAGPTEIVIVAADGDPRLLAADLLAQAEHDEEAAAILLTTSRRLARAVAQEIERQLATLPTAPTARAAIEHHGAIVLVRSLEQALEFANRYAPEHLSLPDRSLLAGVRHAGSVFLGACSPEAAGDYASGPNHVLPTSGYARIRGGLSAADFVKVITVQELTAASLKRLAPAITTLARAEGLEAHARSVEVRLDERAR